MPTSPNRRLPAVLAAVFAMAASLAAIGAVVVSDLAYAEEAPVRQEADDVLVAPPVKLAKVEVKAAVQRPEPIELPEPTRLPKLKRSKRAKVDFGSFEGY